jgi:Protein of unknown function (DUF499)
MMFKPWYQLIYPREDLREAKPLDAAEFAVHLDQVRDGRAPSDYQNPHRFFERTYMTHNLTNLTTEVVRRLSGERIEASAVFNLTTQFGGGKTHALTLLYHLVTHGQASSRWFGVQTLLDKASVPSIPKAATAVFVGTEFDSLTGRGGDDGTPLRRTPWGEIAYQLRGEEGLALLAEHEQQFIAPAGDVIHKMFPPDKPCLILMDELISYVSRNRTSGRGDQLYNFLQSLSEAARGNDKVVLVVSIPASTLEMTAEDESDYNRYKKLLDRLSKAMMLSAESETSEIIRRRLFEWDNTSIDEEGKVKIPREATHICKAYADWVLEYRHQLPSWFPLDHAQQVFEATYPFHPVVLSVFERKWRSLPRFQQTRGILRLLAQWVSKAYSDGYTGAYPDPLIGLGTAPLDNSLFRSATLEQLGEQRLEAVITTDICGKSDAHALRLDQDATDSIKKARLHQKIATSIFFESNGGQEHAEATLPEIRLAVAEPELDIGSVETVLETLETSCYYLSVQKNRYSFSLRPNLNKLLADRRASVQSPRIVECVHDKIKEVFKKGTGVEPIYFPQKSGDVPNRQALTVVVLAPNQSLEELDTIRFVETLTREYGTSFRTYKNALLWCVTDSATSLYDEARKYLAWRDIKDDDYQRLDDQQQRQLEEHLARSQRDLQESVWRSYKFLLLLGKDNAIHTINLGLVHSSAAKTLLDFILLRLRQDGEVVENIGVNFLLRHWPPAFTEWSTKSVRDTVYASPLFPRLLNAETLKNTIAQGVTSGQLAYVEKKADEDYEPFIYGTELHASDVEFSDEVYIITRETAEQYNAAKFAQTASPPVEAPPVKAGVVRETPSNSASMTGVIHVTGTINDTTTTTMPQISPAEESGSIAWSGEVPPLKWMTFYSKVLSKFILEKGLKLTLHMEIAPDGGISKQKVDETRVALRELGLSDDVEIS